MALTLALLTMALLSMAAAQQSGCGADSLCVSEPHGCTGDACEYAVRLQRMGSDRLRVELRSGPIPENVANDENFYVAFGFSATPSMSEMLAFACSHDHEAPAGQANSQAQVVYAKWQKGPKRRVGLRGCARNLH